MSTNTKTVLWNDLPETLQNLPAQPPVTQALLREFRQDLPQCELNAFVKLQLPRFRVTEDMLGDMLTFDAQEYWRNMLSDRWGEHQVPDLPAYRWMTDGHSEFREYARNLRPYGAMVGRAVLASRFEFEKDACPGWYKALASRAAEFASWCQSDECSIWAGDYDLCQIVEYYAYFFDMHAARLSAVEKKDFLDGFESFAAKMRAVINLFKPEIFPQDSHVFVLAGMYAELCVLLHAHGRGEGTRGLEYWRTMINAFPGFGGDDGGWAQGTSYWKWKLPPFLVAAEPMRDLGFADLTATKFLANTGYFKWYLQPPYMRCGTFGDHPNLRAQPLDLAIVRYLGKIYRQEDLIGYADDYIPPRGCEYDGGPDSASLTALLLLLKTWNIPPKTLRSAPAAPSRFFKDVGVVACHSKLGDAENDVTVLFRSSSYGSAGHAHADQNSFIAEAFGQPIFIDAGYYPEYHHPHMKGFTIQTQAHNTLLLNNQGQSIRNFNAVGMIEHFEAGADYDYMIGQCADAYPSHPELVRRHLWFQRGARFPWILIVDHVKLRQPGNVDFLLHSYEEPQWDASMLEAEFAGWRMWGTQARARVQFLAPAAWYWDLTNHFPYPADGRESNQPRQWHARATTRHASYEHWLITGIVFGKVETRSPILAPAFQDLRPRFECKGCDAGWKIQCGESQLMFYRFNDKIEHVSPHA